jgi:hypothetical protein
MAFDLRSRISDSAFFLQRLGIVFAFTLLATLSGCKDSVSSEVAAKNDSNIKRVANLYGGFQSMHGWRGPGDEKSLKQFAKGLPDKSLAMMKIDREKLDEVFASERDGKPFKIRFAVQGGPGAVEALVFEQVGVNGKKLVAFNGGYVEDTDEGRFKELQEGRGGGPLTAATTSKIGTAPRTTATNAPAK